MMNEDELMKQALEDELEDSYQEYLTHALKGETQDLMQTSSEYRHNMEELCRESEHLDTKVVSIRPNAKKKKIYLFTKIASGLAAAAAVILLCFFCMNMILTRSDDSRRANDMVDGEIREVAQNTTDEQSVIGAGGDTKTAVSLATSAVIEDSKNAATTSTLQIGLPPEVVAASVEDSASPTGEIKIYRANFLTARAGIEMNGIDSIPGATTEHNLTIPTRKGKDEGDPLTEEKRENENSVALSQIEIFLPKQDAIQPGVIRSAYVEKDRVSYSEISREELEDGARVVLELPADLAVQLDSGANLNILLIVSYGRSDVLLTYQIQ